MFIWSHCIAWTRFVYIFTFIIRLNLIWLRCDYSVRIVRKPPELVEPSTFGGQAIEKYAVWRKTNIARRKSIGRLVIISSERNLNGKFIKIRSYQNIEVWIKQLIHDQFLILTMILIVYWLYWMIDQYIEQIKTFWFLLARCQ